MFTRTDERKKKCQFRLNALWIDNYIALFYIFRPCVLCYILVAVTHILTTLLCFLAHRKVGRLQIFEAFHEMSISFVLV